MVVELSESYNTVDKIEGVSTSYYSYPISVHENKHDRVALMVRMH